MISADLLEIDPVKARLDISTACQLGCPCCPTEENGGRVFLRNGTMSHGEFVRFLEHNPRITTVELAGSGESLLNPELPRILKCAYERGVATSLGGGVNMNDISDEALEALVRYKTARIRVAVDGITEETYRKYRVGGSLRKVLDNIVRLNGVKRRYHSPLPELVLQFIVFEHNEHEVERAVVLGRMLGMKLFIRLNRSMEPLTVKNKEKIRNLAGYADREEYLEATSSLYCDEHCLFLWKSPQVNWDGRLLGCCENKRMPFADYALGGDFLKQINNERMRYARRMLMGKASPRDDIPCSSCDFFQRMREHSLWFTPERILSAIQDPGAIHQGDSITGENVT